MAAIEAFTSENLAGQLDYFIDHQDEYLVSRGVRVNDNTYAMQLLEDHTIVVVRFEVIREGENGLLPCPVCGGPMRILRDHLLGECPAIPIGS
jgi:hypothetical protein